MTDTLVAPTKPELDLDEDHLSHIVAGDKDHTGIELVMNARIDGTPVTALCGYTWVPSRDPKRHPLCPECEEIARENATRQGRLNFDPRGLEP